MRTLLAVAAACLLTTPALAGATSPPESLYDQVERLIVEGLGGMPDSARVDGEAVPVAVAFAQLRDVVTLQPRAAGPVRLPSHDLGVGAGAPCAVPSGLFLAAAFGFGAQAVVNDDEVAVGVPGCGSAGVYGGDIAPTAAIAVACTVVGAFVNEGGPGCHTGDFGGITIAGNYLGVFFEFCFFGFCIELVTVLLFLGLISLQE